MRFMSRILIIAAVVLALTIVSVPTAHARPLDDGTPVLRLNAHWFEAALSWIARLLPTGNQDAVQRSTALDVTTTGGKIKPNTGSCIDPQGIGCPGM